MFFSFSDPFTMLYLEGDRAMLNCSSEYNETIQLSSVLYNYSTCSHGDKYGIFAMGIQHAVLMLPIATSEVHVGLMGRRHYKFRIIVKVSYISY